MNPTCRQTEGLAKASVYPYTQAAAINGTPVEPPRLLDRLRFALRIKHYSYWTEQAYLHCVCRFILHHGKRHPQEMGGAEIEAFLTHLAVEGHVFASTQTQALSPILFLYRSSKKIDWMCVKFGGRQSTKGTGPEQKPQKKN